ncbi:MAG: family 43 glycosylhydrolase [Lachnospiraceae bacterium]|nr:family 43 glycosylhydrolase [Lachnospiraceae bacterium]
MMMNPITKTDYPDPDVIRVGDTFYMVSTTMYFFPGGEILRSYDLVHWEIAARIFDAIDDTGAEHLSGTENAYGKGMWAASLRYHDGRFYVLFVSHGQQDTHLYTAPAIEGPWEHKRIKGYFHDASLLFDDDGRVFLTSGNMQIHLTELNEELSAPKEGGIDTVIIRDDPEKVFLGYEGSHFYKINGRYYITLIHWPKSTSRRTEAVFTADRVEGPYIGCDVCSDDMGYHGQGVAQGGIVDAPDGRWYSIMFRDSGAIGRVPVLVPVRFTTRFDGKCHDAFTGAVIPGACVPDFRDGLTGETAVLSEGVPFPVFGDDGIIPKTFETPDLKPGYSYEPLFASDDFKCSLRPQWQWNHIPDSALWKVLPEGGLSVTTGTVSANPTEARNTLTQRMAYPACSGTVTVDATGLKDGDIAGLIALQGKYGMIGIAKENGSCSLVRLVREEAVKGFGIGSSDHEPGTITDRIPLDGPVVRLKIDADFTDMKDEVTFSYEKDGTFARLGEPHKLVFRLDHFTGARFGLCVFATKEPGGTAVFREFRYE